MAYSKYNTARFRGEIPVKEGETYEIEIEGIGEKGDGIGKIKGYVVIVPNTKKGEKVKVKVTAVRGRVSFGEVIGRAEKKEEDSAGEDEETGGEETGEEEEEAGGEDEPQEGEEEEKPKKGKKEAKGKAKEKEEEDEDEEFEGNEDEEEAD